MSKNWTLLSNYLTDGGMIFQAHHRCLVTTWGDSKKKMPNIL